MRGGSSFFLRMVKFGLVLPTVDLSFLELPAGALGVGREEEWDLV